MVNPVGSLMKPIVELGESFEYPLVFDIETDGLRFACSRIHCVAIHNIALDETTLYHTKEGIVASILILNGHKAGVAGHNVVSFDIPVVKRYHPHFNPQAILDTKLWSQLSYNNLVKTTADHKEWRKDCPKHLWQNHGLEAWGYRLGHYKGDYGKRENAWEVYTFDMGEYCKQDTKVNAELLKFFWLNAPTSEQALRLEHDVAQIISFQEENGIHYDTQAALELFTELKGIKDSLFWKLQAAFPPWQVFKDTFVPKVNSPAMGYVKGVPIDRYKTVEFNPNSNDMVTKILVERYKWIPEAFTDGGENGLNKKPKLDEDVFKDIAHLPHMQEVLEYRQVCKIISFVTGSKNSWMALVDPDGKLRGSVQSCGAYTRRMTHSKPNLAQVPSVKKVADGMPPGIKERYGSLCRKLFKPPQGYVLCGCDADQLELRTVAHYMFPWDGGRYVTAAIQGDKKKGTDIHSINAKAMGFAKRDDGKAPFYAYLYGAWLFLLGQLKTGSWDRELNIREGRKMKDALERGVPALPKLKNEILSRMKDPGFCLDLDGQPFTIRSDHSSLNELNQRAGAIIMKRALVILWNDLIEAGWIHGIDFLVLLNIHDEWQTAVKPEKAEAFCEMAKDAIRKSGEFYNLHCPVSGAAKVGNNWAETH